MSTSPLPKTHFGLGVMYPAPGLIERIGPDWDWIWLDGQHGQIAGYDTMLAMVRACDLIDRPAYVRVPGHEPGGIGLTLDMGVHAVIVPQVDTIAQAKALIRAAKFPPLGNRSFGGRRPIDLHGRDYVATANDGTGLICQIESPEAVGAASDIAALPGVAGLFVGPDDLRLRWGQSMSAPSDSRLDDAVRHVAESCRAQGKDCFCVATATAQIKLYARIGVTHIVSGSDVGFLAVGSKAASRSARETVHESAASPAHIY